MLHQLDESDNGRTVVLRSGEMLRIVLPENATTGYRWTVEQWDREVAGPVAEAPQYPPGSAVGAGGHVEFLFKAGKSGFGEIVLREWRPWAGSGSVIGRYRIYLEVR
jgi:inhibitor of cysteine peptidase